jgi:hypothetical protein
MPLTAKMLHFSATGVSTNQIAGFSIFYFVVQLVPLTPTIPILTERDVALFTDKEDIRLSLTLPMDVLYG